MINQNFHRLLKRQLKKQNFSSEKYEQLLPFLEEINLAYINSQNDITHLENILEKSSQELYTANQSLQKDVQSTKLQLDRVVNTVNEVIFQTDVKGNWVFLNQAWETMTGYTIEESIGKNYLEFLSKLEKEDIDFLQEDSPTDAKIIKTIFRYYEGDETKWFELTFRWTYDEEEKIDGSIGTIVDISDLKKTEAKLLKADAAKNEFLSTMSHECRTPLNAVIGITNNLLMENPNPDQLENLNALKFSSNHLLGLINDILDFNKIEAGKVDIYKSEFCFDDLLEGLKHSFEFKAKEKDIRFVIKKEDDIPSSLIGDSIRLSQVLANLISNAIKFTSKGKVVLDIEILDESDGYCTLNFEVHDTGIGIPQDKLKLIFESFTQAEAQTTKKYGGTGLGLSISKKLLKLQNSDLHVHSIEGRGTTFHFMLKFEKSTTTKKEDEQIKQIDISTLDGLEVLVVEDNSMNVLVLRNFFKKWNVSFDVAENGQLGLEQVQIKDYHVVLMDLQMPIMDGYTATKEIRNLGIPKYENLPIIALTASVSNNVIDKVHECGVNDYLPKPFVPKELFNKLAQHLPQL